MANLKLEELQYGTLNGTKNSNATGTTGDPRRTSALASLRRTQRDAYAKDVTGTGSERNGIVVLAFDIDFPGYTDRAGLLWQFQRGTVIEDAAEYDAITAARRVAYKVFIPDNDPRPTPGFNAPNDPVTISLPEIYANIPNLKSPIAVGSLVVVAYEDVTRLFNPTIVRILSDNLSVESENFNERTGGDRTGGALKESFTAGAGVANGPAAAPRSNQAKKDCPKGYSNETVDTTSLVTAPDRGSGANDSPDGLHPARFPGSVWSPAFCWSGAGGGGASGYTGARGQDARKYIVLHTTETGNQGAINSLRGFRASNGKLYKKVAQQHSCAASINYVVLSNGTIHSIVADEDRAWHAGANSKTDTLRTGVRSSNSIGIEVAGHAADPRTWTDAAVRALAKLLKYLVDKYSIPVIYAGLPPGTRSAYSNGHPKTGNPQRIANHRGTGQQTNAGAGLFAHGRVTPGRRYDPGVHFPWSRVKSLMSGVDIPQVDPAGVYFDDLLREDQPEPPAVTSTTGTPTTPAGLLDDPPPLVVDPNDPDDPANWTG